MKELFEEVIDKLPILTLKQVEKGQILHREDTICLKIFLVKKGVLRSFYFVNEKDITAHFAMDYGIIGAADSTIKQKKSRYNIEALEPSEVYVLDYIQMESYLTEHPELEKLARKFTELIYMDLVERMEGMLFLSARERYENLVARYPDLIGRVNLGHVASYLGITQETLSRVRGPR